MPTYEYRCRDCGQDLEVVQSFHDDPLTVCPNCQGALRKVFSPIGIAFKGSGFYKTDNRSSSGASAGNGASAGSSGSAGETTGSSGDSGDSGTKAPDSGGSTNSGSGDSGSGKETAATSS